MRRALDRLSGSASTSLRSDTTDSPAQTSRPQQQTPSEARARHRFSRSGEVPVSGTSRPNSADVAAPQQSRLATIETALKTERTLKARAERELAQATAVVLDLQTKQGHAELAIREIKERYNVQLERLNADQAGLQQALTAELAAERTARALAEDALQKAIAVHQQSLARRAITSSTPSSTVPPVTSNKTKLARRSAPQKAAPEPKPVKWWR